MTPTTSRNNHPERDALPTMTERQRAVYDLLCTGFRSVAEISRQTGFCDPRGHIRDLREKGINVQGEWRKVDGVRYKLYSIPSPSPSPR